MRNEDINFRVQSFVQQTEKGAIAWNCEDYIPASFLPSDDLEDDDRDCITHMGTFTHTVPGRSYELGISEYVETDTGDGSIHITLVVNDENNAMIEQVDAEINSGDASEDEYGFLPLCDAIFQRTDEWMNTEFFERLGEPLPFYQQKGITKKQREQPLCRLMERLMNERRVEDFHRMVMDRAFREQLLQDI